MKLTDKQIERLVQLIFRALKDQNFINYKSKEEAVHARAKEIVSAEFTKERLLDQEVEVMMDDLEQKNPGEFQRYKMFPLLKKRLAVQKGLVLEDRVSHFASLIINGVWNDDIVDYENEDKAMRIAKTAGQNFQREVKDLDEKARLKVASLKKTVIENTPEWDVMYRKYYDEELQKRGN